MTDSSGWEAVGRGSDYRPGAVEFLHHVSPGMGSSRGSGKRRGKIKGEILLDWNPWGLRKGGMWAWREGRVSGGGSWKPGDQEQGRSRIWQVRTNLDARDMPGEDVQRLKYVSAPWTIVRAWYTDLRGTCSGKMVSIMGEFEIPKVENTAKQQLVAEDETRGIPLFM